MKKIRIFFAEMANELRRVIWPGPEKVAENTRIVVISTVVFALVFGTVDYLFIYGLNFVF